MSDLEAERIALRALALLPIDELPAYGDDPATSIRVAITLNTNSRSARDKSPRDEDVRRVLGGQPKK